MNEQSEPQVIDMGLMEDERGTLEGLHRFFGSFKPKFPKTIDKTTSFNFTHTGVLQMWKKKGKLN